MATYATLSRLEAEEKRRKEGDEKRGQEIAELAKRVEALEGKPEPEPEPEPPPPEPTDYWKVLLEDAFPSMSGFVQGSDNTSKPIGEGEYCIFRLGTGSGRSELSINNGSEAQKWREGERFLLEGKLTVAPGFGWGGPGRHCTIVQFKGLESGDGSPQISLELGDYGQGPGLCVQDLNRSTNRNFLVVPDEQLIGDEVLVQLEVTVSKQKKGRYALRVDGKLVAEGVETNTLQTISAYGFIKLGIYAGSASAPRELKFRDVRLFAPA